MRLLRLAAASASILAALVPATALAHDHRPPDAEIRTRGDHEPGRLVTSCWIRSSEKGGTTCRQMERTFPEPLESRGATVSIAFDSPREPRRVRLRGWRQVPASGRPDYRVRRLEGDLRPGGRGWVAALDLPGRRGHWFLEAKGVWTDARFPNNEQFGVWTFALRVP